MKLCMHRAHHARPIRWFSALGGPAILIMLVLVAGCPGGSSPLPDTGTDPTLLPDSVTDPIDDTTTQTTPQVQQKYATVGQKIDLEPGVEDDGSSSYEWLQTGGPTIQISDANGFLFSFTPEEGGEYDFQVIIRQDAGFTYIITIHVSVFGPTPLQANAGPDQDAKPADVLVLAGSASGGAPPYQYSWTPTTGLDDPTKSQPTVTVSIPTTYMLTVTDSEGNMSSDDMLIKVPLRVDAGADQIVSAGDSVTLIPAVIGGTPPYQYAWSPADGLSDPTVAQPVASPAVLTEYTLTVTDSNGLSASDRVTVVVATMVSGPIWSDTTWTQAQNPYMVIGDVQIPAGVTLNIEPGVDIRYVGQTQLYVTGAVVAEGSEMQRITFRGTDSAIKSSATFIKFEGADLSASRLAYVTMGNAAQAIRLGEESPSQQKAKNSGTLTISHAELDQTEVMTNGYFPDYLGISPGRLVLKDSVLTHTAIIGEHESSEPIDLVDSTISDCEVVSDAYNHGINVQRCTAARTRFVVLGMGANESFDQCALDSCTISGVYGEIVSLSRCQATNVLIYAAMGEVTISDCTFQYDQAYPPAIDWRPYPIPGWNVPEAKITVDYATIEYSRITGNGIGPAIELLQHYKAGTANCMIRYCTIENNEVGVRADSDRGCQIAHSNLLSNSRLAIDNNRPQEITATDNYWDTSDASQIPSMIHDYYDDITLGKVIFEPFSSAPISDAGPRQ